MLACDYDQVWGQFDFNGTPTPLNLQAPTTMSNCRRNDNQRNDIQHNDTRHSNTKYIVTIIGTLYTAMLSVIILSVITLSVCAKIHKLQTQRVL
jgi:hypothetical protein